MKRISSDDPRDARNETEYEEERRPLIALLFLLSGSLMISKTIRIAKA